MEFNITISFKDSHGINQQSFDKAVDIINRKDSCTILSTSGPAIFIDEKESIHKPKENITFEATVSKPIELKELLVDIDNDFNELDLECSIENYLKLVKLEFKGELPKVDVINNILNKNRNLGTTILDASSVYFEEKDKRYISFSFSLVCSFENNGKLLDEILSEIKNLNYHFDVYIMQ